MAFAPIYTRRLFEVATSVPGTATISVPDGEEWVLRDWSGHFFPPGTGNASLELVVDGKAVFKRLCPPNRGRDMEWSGRQVAESGNTVQVISDPGGGFLSGLLTGYIFTS